MSESSYRFTASGRRQPTKGRQRVRKVQKPGNSRVKAAGKQRPPQQGGTVSRVIINPSSSNGKKPRKRQRVEAPAETWLRKKKASQATSRGMKSAAVNGRIPPLKFNKRVTKRVKVSNKTRLKPMARTMLYILRLLIVGVGIGAIVGTALSVLDPANQYSTASNPSKVEQNQPQAPVNNQGLYLTQEIIPLKSNIQNLVAANPNLAPGILIADLDSGNYIDINASNSFSAASTIKIPILVAFFQDVEAGKIKLDEPLTMTKDMIVGGSGDMRSKPVGSQFTALEVADKMMVISDNTATNMLIARMGGINALNQRFRSWGLTATSLQNPLPDIQGTNTTSPRELAEVIAMVSKGQLVSSQGSRQIFDIMRRNQRRHLLPKGLGSGARIANKTGYIGAMLGDVGLIELPSGKRYIAAVMVKRPRNDSRADTLITSVSRSAYQHFNQPVTMPGTPGNNILPPSSNSPYLNSPPTGINTYQPPLPNPVPNGVSNALPTTTYPNNGYNSQYYPYRR
ncbi:MAG: serine hydrolase [Rivularia sp. (in: Bacteria)]|nr:serine hydrolase [Rivularia sp. MS3]